jgi:hypothetical protein
VWTRKRVREAATNLNHKRPPVPEQIRRLPEVFGVSREIPMTYQARDYVDGKFIDSLARDKHLVVFGGSKQGKTCLRKHSLQPDDYVVVQCSNAMTSPQLYSTLLKEAGATVEVTEKRTTKGDQKLSVEFTASANIPFLSKGEGKFNAARTSASEATTERKHLEIDPADPNDVIRVLQAMKFTRFIVLEDFHYLAEDVQRQIAMDLKAFHEKSNLCFIVVGVWLESNRLVLYNGDLAGRLIPIDVDRWKTKDLVAIITTGEALLNVNFADDVKQAVIDAAQGNVGILQETCYRLCEARGATLTKDDLTLVGSTAEVATIVKDLAREQAGRYQNFLTKFIEGFQRTDLEMYKWIAYVIISASTEDLKKGLRAFDIFTRMQQVHPYRERLLHNNVIQALRNVGKLQHLNRVQPVVLDFDSNENELRIVDSGFTLFLASHDKQQLKELIGLGVLPPRADAPASSENLTFEI